MIDHALDNRLFVIADGPDLLAHDGATETLAWRAALPAPAVVVGQTPTHVVVATADGTALWFDRGRGRVEGHLHVGGPLAAGAANRRGGVVVLAADGRLLGVNTGPVPLAPVATISGATG